MAKQLHQSWAGPSLPREAPHCLGPLPGMLLAQLMVTTISRSKRSQRVATAGRCPSGPAGSGMAYSFSGSTTSRWDTSAFTGAVATVGRGTHSSLCQPFRGKHLPRVSPLWPSSIATGQPGSDTSLRETPHYLLGKASVCGQVLSIRKPSLFPAVLLEV